MASNYKIARARRWIERGFGRKDAAALAGIPLDELRDALRRRTKAERVAYATPFRERRNQLARRRYAERFGRVRASRYSPAGVDRLLTSLRNQNNAATAALTSDAIIRVAGETT